jgi:hypothetical protein
MSVDYLFDGAFEYCFGNVVRLYKSHGITRPTEDDFSDAASPNDMYMSGTMVVRENHYAVRIDGK